MAFTTQPEVKTTVVTPTTGTHSLYDACLSVANQTKKADHLIVIDGSHYTDRVYNILVEVSAKVGAVKDYKPDIIELPFNTGHDYWLGLKIYSAMCQLVQNPYMAMLDEDNSFEPDWVQTMEDALTDDLYYVTCRRTIYGENGQYIGIDNHESIGENKYGYKLYDTNTWLMQVKYMRSFIPSIIHKWDGDRYLTNTAFELPHKHLSKYYGTIYTARENMYYFFNPAFGNESMVKEKK